MKKAGSLCLILCLLLPSALFADVRDPVVEGVMIDHENPEQSLAILDGEPVKVGGTSGEFRLISIDGPHVEVEHFPSGVHRVLEVKAAVKAASPEAPAAALPAAIMRGGDAPALPAEVSVSTAGKSVGELFKELGGMIQQGRNPMIRVWELMGLKELAIIYNAAVIYFQKKQVSPKNIEDLIALELLPGSYKGSTRGKYKYYFDAPIFGVHADPLNPKEGLLAFYIGSDAVVRESKNGPADAHSPPHEYPGRRINKIS